MERDLTIRDAAEGDAGPLQAIYAYHVLHGTASYDIEPPDVGDMAEKIRRVLDSHWPFLVAVSGGEAVGYAYATQLRDRAAYRFTAEDSIYVRPDQVGQGIGKTLLEALIERSAQCGFRTMIAVIGGAEPASVALHRSCGFEEAGRLKRVGFKHGRWLDSIYMQRDLGGPDRAFAEPAAAHPFKAR